MISLTTLLTGLVPQFPEDRAPKASLHEDYITKSRRAVGGVLEKCF